MVVEVVSAPEARPAAGAAHAGGSPSPAPGRRWASQRTASVANTPSVTPICSAVESSARSATSPTAVPGIAHASITSDSCTSGCGRRPSVPSVIRFTTSPSSISSPTACAGVVAANSSGALTSAKPKPVADCSAAPASTATPAAISRAPTTPSRLITCHP